MESTMDANVHKVASHLWESLDTPRALTCYLLARYGEWDQLASLRVDPSLYSSAWSFFKDAQATELLRKADFLPLKVDRRQAAFEEFQRCEHICKETNDRLDRWIHYRTFESRLDHRLYDFIERVQKRLKKILGRLPDEILGRFGPGATFETRGSVTLGDKFQALTCTAECVDLLKYVDETAWGRCLQQDNRWKFSIVRGNRFTTVPKDAVKDRGICVEPGVNVFLQLGVGQALRARLHRVGIDLDEGQALHRLYAMEGSLTGSYSTIDLSSASDTVCTNLVKLLLPPEWFELLDCLRSRFTRVKGRWHQNQKFSSMGNGFTFELETLIFYGIVKEVCNELTDDVLVYGDDIIIPTNRFNDVIWALRYFGFSPNPRKSFGAGNFRESCGGDFFQGVDVRPFYLKECPREPSDWFSFHNGLKRVGSSDSSRDLITRRARSTIIQFVPRRLRKCVGPMGFGDLVICSDSPPTTKVVGGRRYLQVWAPVPRSLPLGRWSPNTQLALALYGVPSSGLTPRGWVSGYRLSWVEHTTASSEWSPPYVPFDKARIRNDAVLDRTG